MEVALVHDYLTQRGGAERVILALMGAFPGAPLYTSLYEAGDTFPAFAGLDVRTLPINRVGVLRRHHRLALPFLAGSFSRLHVEAEVVICSSSGWAHGAATDGHKLVYCHTPARWLYQTERYLRGRTGARGPLVLMRPALRRWDRGAVRSADRYLVNSTAVAARVRAIYGLEPTVVHPPPGLQPGGPSRPMAGLEPGFVLCISRLVAYKNLDEVVEAFAQLAPLRLVIAGGGPLLERLRAKGGPNVTLVGEVDDAQLRWLYASCAGVVAASYEDYGLTPLEAASFGKPAAVLAWGGFLDTVVEGSSGVFFTYPEPAEIATAIGSMVASAWQPEALAAQAARFSPAAFAGRMREIAGEALGRAPGPDGAGGDAGRGLDRAGGCGDSR